MCWCWQVFAHHSCAFICISRALRLRNRMEFRSVEEGEWDRERKKKRIHRENVISSVSVQFKRRDGVEYFIYSIPNIEWPCLFCSCCCCFFFRLSFHCAVHPFRIQSDLLIQYHLVICVQFFFLSLSLSCSAFEVSKWEIDDKLYQVRI